MKVKESLAAKVCKRLEKNFNQYIDYTSKRKENNDERK